jgi:hypothetical protein
MQLRELIAVAPRFTRSINVERDAGLASGVDGYVLTGTGRSILERIGLALKSPGVPRAWTLTGPYGSGKSAFALFLANLLGPSDAPAGKLARTILKEQSPDIYRAHFDGRVRGGVSPRGFTTVLVSGSQEPFHSRVLRACAEQLKIAFPRNTGLLREIEALAAKAESGARVSPTDTIEALLATSTRLQKSDRSQGLFLIVDELGKFLEYAARNAEGNDLFLFQQLAESTAVIDSGLCLLTILHQAFDRYVSDLRPKDRDEWSKIQGRFEDIAFQESPEQLLHLIAHAIRHSDAPGVRAMEKEARRLADTAWSLGLAPRGFKKTDFCELLVRCAPLHPLATLVIVRLCRKFGQNQRSLFSFLVSNEPNGFARFLDAEIDETRVPFYRLSELYEFVSAALGSGLALGESATRWAEIQGALDRAANLSNEERRLISVVGLLNAIGPYGEIKASRELLAFEKGDEPASSRRITNSLVKHSLFIYRKHNQSFGLWQGSDIDLESRVKEADRHLSEVTSLASRLTTLWRARPLVAKRHSYRTGTLRYFALRFADSATFSSAIESDASADGLIVYCLPNVPAEAAELENLAQSTRDRVDVLVAIAREVDSLRESVRDLERLTWIDLNTPELRGDGVARRELNSRILSAEERVSREIERLFSPQQITSRATDWFHRGFPVLLPSIRSLAALLSDICEQVYPHTPILRNELINRRTLSSAAAKARRNLIEAMVQNAAQPDLGIVGTPPEMSMYVSLLRSTGIHRPEPAGWGFRSPQNDEALGVVWTAIEDFFAGCELQRRSAVQLFTMLQQRPFGLKMGVIPVLFCAASLAHDTEVALYEAGAFVPDLTVEVFERLLRVPERFEIRRFRVEGVRREVFRRFAELLGASSQSKAEDVVAIVRPLYRFFSKLPSFTKQTRRVSANAIAVRDALFAAREPDLLLFEDLPRACGADPFPPTSYEPERVAGFFQNLQAALSELQRAYDDLIAELREMLLRAFGVSGPQVRDVLRFRAQRVSEHAVEARLRAFVLHLADQQLDGVAWIEAIATMIAGKAPASWLDNDRARYEVVLSELVRNFRHIEALVFELSRHDPDRLPSDIIRIGVTDPHSKDLEAVVTVEAADGMRVTDAVIAVESVLEHLNLELNPDLALAVLAKVSRRFLAELDETGSRTTARTGAPVGERNG